MACFKALLLYLNFQHVIINLDWFTWICVTVNIAKIQVAMLLNFCNITFIIAKYTKDYIWVLNRNRCSYISKHIIGQFKLWYCITPSNAIYVIYVRYQCDGFYKKYYLKNMYSKNESNIICFSCAATTKSHVMFHASHIPNIFCE